MAGHPLFAAVYDRLMSRAEAGALGRTRAQVVGRARGRVLDVGAGTGANLAHYRAGQVDTAVLVEPDDHMRRRLEAKLVAASAGAAAGLPRVEVVGGALPGLGLEPSSFDTIVCTLVLCTVPEVAAGLAELRTLLRPGGQLLFIEHVRAPGVLGWVQRAATPAWSVAAAGCHLDRDTVAGMRGAGFVIAELERPSLRPTAGAREGGGSGWLIAGRAIPRAEVTAGG